MCRHCGLFMYGFPGSVLALTGVYKCTWMLNLWKKVLCLSRKVVVCHLLDKADLA